MTERLPEKECKGCGRLMFEGDDWCDHCLDDASARRQNYDDRHNTVPSKLRPHSRAAVEGTGRAADRYEYDRSRGYA